MATTEPSWPYPPTDYPPAAPEAGPAPPLRPSKTTLLVGILTIAGAATLAIGVVRVGPRTRDHQAAVDRLTAIQRQNTRLRDALRSNHATATEIRTTLASQRTRVAYLLHARAT